MVRSMYRGGHFSAAYQRSIGILSFSTFSAQGLEMHVCQKHVPPKSKLFSILSRSSVKRINLKMHFAAESCYFVISPELAEGSTK